MFIYMSLVTEKDGVQKATKVKSSDVKTATKLLEVVNKFLNDGLKHYDKGMVK